MKYKSKTYNGWKNHATWLVSLWTEGDDTMREIANHKGDRFSDSVEELKEYVMEMYIETFSQASASLAHDLMMSSLSDVDWLEIAAHLLDEDDEGEDDETVA
jgi:hypothetical protein